MKYVRKRNGAEYEGVLYDGNNGQDLVDFWGLEDAGGGELRLVRPGGSVVVTPGTYVLRDSHGVVSLQSMDAVAADFTAQE